MNRAFNIGVISFLVVWTLGCIITFFILCPSTEQERFDAMKKEIIAKELRL